MNAPRIVDVNDYIRDNLDDLCAYEHAQAPDVPTRLINARFCALMGPFIGRDIKVCSCGHVIDALAAECDACGAVQKP